MGRKGLRVGWQPPRSAGSGKPGAPCQSGEASKHTPTDVAQSPPPPQALPLAALRNPTRLGCERIGRVSCRLCCSAGGGGLGVGSDGEHIRFGLVLAGRAQGLALCSHLLSTPPPHQTQLCSLFARVGAPRRSRLPPPPRVCLTLNPWAAAAGGGTETGPQTRPPGVPLPFPNLEADCPYEPAPRPPQWAGWRWGGRGGGSRGSLGTGPIVPRAQRG